MPRPHRPTADTHESPDSTPRIIIAGVGLVSPVGLSAWQTFRALLEGRTIFDRAAALPADIAPVDLVRALGCVSAAQHAAGDPAIELAARAAQEAMFEADANHVQSHTKSEDRTHNPAPLLHLGTSKGAVMALEATASKIARKPEPLHESITSSPHHPITPSPSLTLAPHEHLAIELQRRLGVPVTRHHVAACASSLVALHQARLDLLHGPTERDTAVVVTAEAALTPLFIHSYERLGVLAGLTRDGYRARPIDGRRTGFALAELAAAVVLKRVGAVEPGQIELVDTALGSESYDIIRPAPRMTALAKLARELTEGRPIDLLHPHAPGTGDHDAAELAAYAPVERGATSEARNEAGPEALRRSGSVSPQLPTSENCPDVYAVKGALGHGLGAAGLVSLVLACLCARTGRRPPMPWLTEPIPASHLRLTATAPPPRSIRTQAIFAAGFAGHLAGAVIRRA